VALQLTNILRDVGVDFRNGRRYLPDEDFERFGCSWTDVEREVQTAGGGVRSDAVRQLLEFQGARARRYFARAVGALPQGDARRFVPAEIMRAVYWELLLRIERANYDVFTGVIRVPRPTQARVAMATWWRTR
jgi:phytoene synthase